MTMAAIRHQRISQKATQIIMALLAINTTLTQHLLTHITVLPLVQMVITPMVMLAITTQTTGMLPKLSITGTLWRRRFAIRMANFNQADRQARLALSILYQEKIMGFT